MLGMALKPEDRGWNDPPIVHFSETNQSHKRGKLLNKRVAFPIHGSNMGSNVGAGYPMQNSPMQNSSMQPTMSTSQGSYMYSGTQGVPGGNNYYPSSPGTYYPQQPQPDQYPQTNTNPQSSFMSSGVVEQAQPIQYQQPSVQAANSGIGTEAMMRLEESLQNLHAMMSTLSPHLLDEVRQSLQVMETMWRGNQLPPEVCDLIFQLSVALRQGNKNYAESLLSSISTSHFNCCRDWISGPSAILHAAGSPPGGNE
ncbi:uncharacterized protein [Hetaerina americana]|uniref:uncharacterized protein n=1 Tax=Hetaerina americana TaxID=62018 RepID=UPI003A7F33D9